MGLGLLACCGLAVAACTAATPRGPDANVTVPAIGRPPAPASVQAALSSEAFTSYAGLGVVASDGLAPGDTFAALHTACMTAGGYGQYAASAPYNIRMTGGLAFSQAFGPWGYVGVSLAEQYGFANPDGPFGSGGPPASSPSLPVAAAAAGNKCLNIVLGFDDAQVAHSMAGIETMNNEIAADVIADPDVKKATKAWSACMAKNGYLSGDPDGFALDEARSIGVQAVTPGDTGPTHAQKTAETAMAVTDAQCTQASDLAGIYFAVQASYEQQFVTANQQALNVAVGQYKAAFARELSKLPELLAAASGTPVQSGRKPGGPGGRRKPSPASSASVG
jgi:hypothetical protein